MDPVEKNSMAYVERSRGIPREERPDDAPPPAQDGEVLHGPAPAARLTDSLGGVFRAVKDKIVGRG